MILESSDDEILAKLSEAATEFHQGVLPNVHVQMKEEFFNNFLSDGTYKTVHTTGKGSSDVELRTAYEAGLGISPEAAADIRPASGYIVHKDWLRTEDGPFGHDLTNAGRVSGPYGAFQLVLKQDVTQRSGYGYGDSLTVNMAPTAFDESDPDVLMNALMTDRGTGPLSNNNDDATAELMMAFLEGQRRGSYEKVHSGLGMSSSPDDAPVKGIGAQNWDYLEALVPGSFTLDEVESIQIRNSDFANWAMTNNTSGVKEQAKQILDTEKLRDMGLSEAEIKYLYSVIDQNPSGMPMAAAMRQLMEYKAMKREKDRIEKVGPKLRVTSDKGLDVFSPEFYGGNRGDDIEKVLMGKIEKGLAQRIRETMKREDDMRSGRVVSDL
jgi:hypothetical protein